MGELTGSLFAEDVKGFVNLLDSSGVPWHGLQGCRHGLLDLGAGMPD